MKKVLKQFCWIEIIWMSTEKYFRLDWMRIVLSYSLNSINFHFFTLFRLALLKVWAPLPTGRQAGGLSLQPRLPFAIFVGLQWASFGRHFSQQIFYKWQRAGFRSIPGASDILNPISFIILAIEKIKIQKLINRKLIFPQIIHFLLVF